MDITSQFLDSSDYPRSYASTNEGQINRSRAWSEDITKHWNVTITGLETFSERTQRYLLYFKPTQTQLQCIHDKFVCELTSELELYSTKQSTVSERNKNTLKLWDTYIDESTITTKKIIGTAFSLDFGGYDGTTVYTTCVNLNETGESTIIATIHQDLRKLYEQYPKGLLDTEASASIFFDTLSGLVEKLYNKCGILTNKKIPVGLTLGFPIEQKSISQASILTWTKGVETGRKTNDPIEGVDIGALLDHALCKKKVAARVKAVISDAVSVLIAGSYEKLKTPLETCSVGVVIGSGVSSCYIQPDAQLEHNFKGSVIGCDFGSFEKSLPVNDVDFEVDYGDESTEGARIFEKMVAAAYLGELCRRLVVKVWQSEAPQLAWVRHSIPWTACARIVEAPDNEVLDITNEILMGLWDWETDVEERRAVRELFRLVFERSAALTAVAIVALSAQTGKLQPAMGGVTCAISGDLYEKCSLYRELLQKYIESLLPEGTSKCIRLYQPSNAIMKGSAIISLINS